MRRWLRGTSLVVFELTRASLLPTDSHASWASDGNLVVSTLSAPTAPLMVTASSGSVIAVWVDARTGYNTDVRAVRWTPNGAPATGWASGGIHVTNITCQKYAPAGIPDGSGGTIVSWSDDRCVGYRQVYACRMTSDGSLAAGWPLNGLRLAPTLTHQHTPVTVADGAGGAFVAWQDLRGTDADIYLQHVDGAGAVAPGWPASGVPVAVVGGVQSNPRMEPDGAGGVYVAWQDRRSGEDDLYLQRVTAAGAIAMGWTANGIVVCDASGIQQGIRVAGDGAGGVLLAWLDSRSGDSDVYGLRVLADGALAAGWTTDGTAVAAEPGIQSAVELAHDGTGGAVLAWQDHRGSDWDVFATRIGAGGLPAVGWPGNGLVIAGGAADQLAPGLASDGAGGVFVTWQTDEMGSADIDVIHLAGDGSPVAGWPAGGTRVCSAPGDQTAPRLAVSGSDAYVLWSDLRAGGSAPALFAQRLLADGPIPVRPSALAAMHHDGQTFLVWTPPPDTGWTHRVYFRTSPIEYDADLASSILLGSVGDSSATDRRLSVLTGALCTFRTDSAATPLAPEQGLFVVTVAADRQGWYAVTSQLRGGPEDRHVVPGGNALAVPLQESLGLPRPVHQRSLACGTTFQEVYTLWTWPEDTPLFPAMSNRASWPYDCGVTHGSPQGPAFVRPHQRGGNFTEQCLGSGSLNEWVLGLDDYTLNRDVCTYWYGYHPGYDFSSDANLPPLTGEVVDYTNRRVLYTIDWWRRTFDLDTSRHYAFGYSLGGTYSMQLGLAHPELIVAAMSVVGKVDFSFESDPDSLSMFNPGTPFRLALSRMWGTTATNLPTSQGPPIYSVVNDDSLAVWDADSGAAYLVNFAGRNDFVVGWAEKIGFYSALESSRLGGAQFWDSRDHTASSHPAAFSPMLDLTYLYRFRSDRSWPAFSNCSVNGNPGDGTAYSGDSLGTLNGAMEWEPALLDSASKWQVLLSTRSLATRWGELPAPESLTVDVTPRRVQRFQPPAGAPIVWRASRRLDGAQVQSGAVTVESSGRITVPGVKTYRTGTWLTLELPSAGAERPGQTPRALAIAPLPNPIRSRCSIAVTWPRSASARVTLYDAIGRRARTLWHGSVDEGEWSLTVDLSELPPGIYLVHAEQAGRSAVRRVTLLR